MRSPSTTAGMLVLARGICGISETSATTIRSVPCTRPDGSHTDVAGSSAWVGRAVVSYSNAAKVDALGVPDALLATHGAVSEPVATAMAEGVRARAGVDVAVAITGIAGPGGGSEEKPVGLVCFAVTGGRGTVVRTSRFTGDRHVVRSLAATTALDLLRRYVRASDAR